MNEVGDGATLPPPSSREGITERVAELGAFIRVQRQIASMSVRKLAELAGCRTRTCPRSSAGCADRRRRSCNNSPRRWQISAETLYVRAGFLSDDSEPMSACATPSPPIPG